MPVAATIIGAVAGIAGTALGLVSAQRQAKAQEEAEAAQRRAESVRHQAMELDAKRKQMEILRTQQRARSLALSNATASGSQFGSGLQGGYGQIAGQSNFNALGVNQGLELGNQMFSANASLSNARVDMANAQTIGSIGAGISGFGRSIGSTFGALNRISGGYGSSYNAPVYGSDGFYSPSSYNYGVGYY